MEHSEGIWGLDRDAVSVVHVNRSDICRWWWWWWVRESCATMTRRPTPTFFLVISQTGLHSTKAHKAQAAPLPVDQHRPIELFAFSQPVQFSSSKLNFCPKKARCYAWCSKSPKMLAKNAVPFICGPIFWVSGS